jgi:hypothetical protein
MRRSAKTTRGDTAPQVVRADIGRTIRVVRGQRVLLDESLARLYGVTTKRLNEQVKRNAARFPEDFLFRLSRSELEQLNRSQSASGPRQQRALRSQSATLKAGRGQHRKYLPYAFTEHGAIMAATVLNSPRAVETSVYVVRAFVKLRELLVSNAALARKLDELERKYRDHDEAITAILSAIRELTNPAPARQRSIGFTADLKEHE